MDVASLADLLHETADTVSDYSEGSKHARK